MMRMSWDGPPGILFSALLAKHGNNYTKILSEWTLDPKPTINQLRCRYASLKHSLKINGAQLIHPSVEKAKLDAHRDVMGQLGEVAKVVFREGYQTHNAVMSPKAVSPHACSCLMHSPTSQMRVASTLSISNHAHEHAPRALAPRALWNGSEEVGVKENKEVSNPVPLLSEVVPIRTSSPSKPSLHGTAPSLSSGVLPMRTSPSHPSSRKAIPFSNALDSSNTSFLGERSSRAAPASPSTVFPTCPLSPWRSSTGGALPSLSSVLPISDSSTGIVRNRIEPEDGMTPRIKNETISHARTSTEKRKIMEIVDEDGGEGGYTDGHKDNHKDAHKNVTKEKANQQQISYEGPGSTEANDIKSPLVNGIRPDPLVIEERHEAQVESPKRKKMKTNLPTNPQDWIDSIGMSVYWKAMTDNGYDTYLALSEVDSQSLITLGVTLEGHKKVLIRQCGKLGDLLDE